MNTISDVANGGANYMLGWLQQTINGGQGITPAQWQEAIDATVAFQRRMIELEAGQ